jgi:DNA-binding transcriptional regulator YdaS (Cro superfamily)
MTYSQACALYGCPRALSIALGVDPSTVAKWRAKRRIPCAHALALLLLLAPGAHDVERETLRRAVFRRHARALRYLRTRRPELLPQIRFDQLAQVPENDERRK